MKSHNRNLIKSYSLYNAVVILKRIATFLGIESVTLINTFVRNLYSTGKFNVEDSSQLLTLGTLTETRL